MTRNLVTYWGEDGNILQQSISVGVHNLNITTGEAIDFPVYRLSLDWLLPDLEYALNNGQAVTREETTCDNGSPCLLITMSVSGRRVWVNLETGQQVKVQFFQTNPDGTENVRSAHTFLLVERMDAPPQDVLDLFEKVLFPSP